MRRKILIFSLIPFLCLVVLTVYTIYGKYEYSTIYGEKQKNLAKFLNVNLEEYQKEKRFPTDYFLNLLEEDMTVREIHQVMRGYDKVLNCGNYAEVYYYFSVDEKIAYRYLIIFDNGKYIGNNYGGFRAYEGINENSSFIPGYEEGCIDGLLEE